jgi:ABC-type glycerol-3-phosphate transport system permease component
MSSGNAHGAATNRWVLAAGALATGGVFVLPLLWMVLAAIVPSARWGESLFPSPFRAGPGNFAVLLARFDFVLYLANSVFIAGMGVLLQWLLATTGGYALAMHRVPGRRVLLAMLTALLIIPMELLIAPQYRLVQGLGIANTSVGLVLPWSVNALGVLYFTRVIAGVPRGMIDAARIAGAGEFAVFRSIVLPMIRPASSTFCLIAFVGLWHGFLWPSIILHRDALFTLPLGVSQMTGGYREDYGALIAGTLLSVLPAGVVTALLFAGMRESGRA